MNTKDNLLRRTFHPLRAVFLALVSGGVACLTAPHLHAGTHTWSGAINDQWNLSGNWSSGGAPATNEAPPVILVFPSNPETRSETRNNIPGLAVDRVTIQRGGYRFSASGSTLRLRGTGEKVWVASSLATGTTIFEPSFGLYLLDTAELEVGTRQSLVIQGRVSGPGGLLKTGTGILELGGTQGNTYLGQTTVEGGQLRLNKSAGVLAVPGDLHVGAGTVANEDVVRLLTANQLPDSRKVVIGPSGWLDLNSRHETVGGLELTGGRVSTGTGTLTLAGNLTSFASDRAAVVQGKVSLGGGHRTFTTALGTASGADLRVEAAVSGTGLYSGLRKEGPGRLELSGNNTYGGPTTVAAGWLTVSSSTGLGEANSASLIPSGTTVRAGATLSVLGVNLGDEDLALAGHGVDGLGALVAQAVQQLGSRVGLLETSTIWVGNLPSQTLTLTRGISGPGRLIKAGPGTLRFAGAEPNTHSGGTEIHEGAMVLAKSAGVVSLPGPVVVGDAIGSDPDLLWLETAGQLSATASVHLGSSGRFTIPAGRSEVMGPISGTGRLVLDGQLSVNVPAGEWVFGGWTTGPGELRKSGTGTLALGGNLQHGRTRVTGGTVRLDSPVNQSRMVLAGGILAGQGHTGPVESQSGLVAPGVGAGGTGGTGVFTTSHLQFSPATTLRLELNGLTGNSQHDQLVTVGNLNLGGAQLDLRFGFVPPAGSKFLLLLNDGTDGVVGRFAGLPEGATFQAGGIPLRITYLGGSGANDVILEVIGEPSNARVATAGTFVDGGFRIRGVGQPAQMFRVDRSQDLRTWQTLGVVRAGEDGRVEFVDPQAAGSAAFYRLLAEEESVR